MRALFSGRWGDTWLFDIIIGGLKDSNKGFPSESVDIITDGTETSERAGAMAEARHRLESKVVYEAGSPQIVFVCHDDLPGDDEELEAILGYLSDGIPVYHIRHLDRQTVLRLQGAAGRRGRKVAPVATAPSVRRERKRSATRRLNG